MGSSSERRGGLTRGAWRAYTNHHHFSGASGSLSMTYFPRATLMIGAPGILLVWVSEILYDEAGFEESKAYRIRRLRSRSLVATM
jgi:hypothetical protein